MSILVKLTVNLLVYVCDDVERAYLRLVLREYSRACHVTLYTVFVCCAVRYSPSLMYSCTYYVHDWITIKAGMGPGIFPCLLLVEVVGGCSYNHCVTLSVTVSDASTGRYRPRGKQAN